MIKFEKLIEVLNENQVHHVIIDSLAAVIHGSAYITNDVDICYERSATNLSAIVKALSPYHPRLRGPKDPNLPFIFDEKTLKNGMNFTLNTDLGSIDLLGEVSGLGTFKEISINAEPTELFQKRCLVISLPDLIRSKRAAGRNKDILILDELEALLELKKQ